MTYKAKEDCKKHNYGLFDIFDEPYNYVYYCIDCRHMKISKGRIDNE